MIDLILENKDFKLVRERLNLVCPFEDLKKLTKAELEYLIALVEFERKFTW